MGAPRGRTLKGAKFDALGYWGGSSIIMRPTPFKSFPHSPHNYEHCKIGFPQKRTGFPLASRHIRLASDRLPTIMGAPWWLPKRPAGHRHLAFPYCFGRREAAFAVKEQPCCMQPLRTSSHAVGFQKRRKRHYLWHCSVLEVISFLPTCIF